MKLVTYRKKTILVYTIYITCTQKIKKKFIKKISQLKRVTVI